MKAPGLKRLLRPRRRRGFWEDAVRKVRRRGGSPRDVSMPPGVIFFENLYLWERAVMEPISGRRRDTPLDWFWRTHVGGRVSRTLSVSCGTGYWERRMAEMGFSATVDAFDYSEAALEWARDLARKKGFSNISYRRADINSVELEPGGYDVVVSVAALHHVLELEHALDQIHRALKPGGLLFFDEYIGPNRMQWPDRVLEVANEILACIPKHKRVRFGDGSIKKREDRVPVERMLETDPTEAVRSEEIIAMVRDRFETVEIKPYGGTLLMPLFMNIVGNFNPEADGDRLILDFCLAAEKILLREKVLEPVFAVGAARKKEDG